MISNRMCTWVYGLTLEGFLKVGEVGRSKISRVVAAFK